MTVWETKVLARDDSVDAVAKNEKRKTKSEQRIANSGLPHMCPIQHVAEALAQGGDPASECSLWDRARTRRDVHLHSLASHHLLGAVEVIGIADQQGAVHPVGAHDDRNTLGGLVGIVALGFGDQVHVRNSASFEIIATYLTFAVARVFACAAGGDDDRRQPTLE